MSNVIPMSSDQSSLSDENRKVLRLLAEGLKEEFVEYLETSEEFAELLHTKVIDFIDEKVPFTNEEAQYDLGFLLMDQVGLKAF